MFRVAAMNQVDQNINKDMDEADLIDLDSLDFSDDQTWLCTDPQDSGQPVDVIDWNLSVEWPANDDEDYQKAETQLYDLLDDILKNDCVSLPDKQKFDSRTYVRPKRRPQRPSVHTVLDIATEGHQNKYLTYNKYGPAPILRLKTFNVDTNTENSGAVKDYALKRKSLQQDDEPQRTDGAFGSEARDRLSPVGAVLDGDAGVPTPAINIDLSQPAHNVHKFNRGCPNILERCSLGMYQSGENLMGMSPPSLVSSLLIDSTDTSIRESLDIRKSLMSHKDSGVGASGRESLDPMMTSMTLSILDEKDMNTSFLSQTTYADHDSLIDCLPPSLVSSVNSSCVTSVNTTKLRPDSTEPNLFSSATFTHLENSERLLGGRPRCSLFNSITKRDSTARNTESYTKAREDTCQSDLDDKSAKISPDMKTTITLHYSNEKYGKKSEDKENLNGSFQKDDQFYKDMGLQNPPGLDRNSLNVTLDKQELNEIIQARQKLSIARKALPGDLERTITLPNQVDNTKVIHLPNQTITVPKQSMDNASELLSRRRAVQERRAEDNHNTPMRNSTFKISPKITAMDTTVVFTKDQQTSHDIIDINSATLSLIDAADRPQQVSEWSGDRAMVCSSETDTTDTGTFSSSSPPDGDAAHDATLVSDLRHDGHGTQVMSTPLVPLRKGCKSDLLNIHNTISPILDTLDDKSHSVDQSQRETPLNGTVVNSATIVRRYAGPKRDILASKSVSDAKRMNNLSPPKSSPTRLSPTATASYAVMPPPAGIPRKTGLPTSKLRQYSSHKDLSRIPAGMPSSSSVGVRAALHVRGGAGGSMLRRSVYASNPALSPTAPTAPNHYALSNRDYQGVCKQPSESAAPRPALVRQGTETLRRERPHSQLVAPKELRANSHVQPAPVASARAANHIPAPSRPYSIAGASQLRVTRPASSTINRPAVYSATDVRPVTATEQRASGLPRPTRLPGPRRRPPSVYSVAPTADHLEHY